MQSQIFYFIFFEWMNEWMTWIWNVLLTFFSFLWIISFFTVLEKELRKFLFNKILSNAKQSLFQKKSYLFFLCFILFLLYFFHSILQIIMHQNYNFYHKFIHNKQFYFLGNWAILFLHSRTFHSDDWSTNMIFNHQLTMMHVFI